MQAERFEVDAVLFDLDGTLIDSGAALERSWTQWAIEHRVTRDQFSAVVAHGRTSADMVAALLATDQVPAALARIEELEAGITDGVRAYPGARALLDALPRDRWAIITSGTSRVARARLRAARLPDPAVLVTADDVTRGKPDPAPYRLGARRLGARPDRCLVLEDAPAGLASAKAAGMWTVAVTTTTPSTALNATAVVDRLTDIRLQAPNSGTESGIVVRVRDSFHSARQSAARGA